MNDVITVGFREKRANLFIDELFVGSGGRYDPQTDSWSTMALTNAPTARHSHVAFWTGSEMVVWGGRIDTGGGMSADVSTGGLYDPEADTWRPTSTGPSGPTWRSSTAPSAHRPELSDPSCTMDQ